MLKTPVSAAVAAVAGVATTAVIASAQSAAAKTATGVAENFYAQCDASVYVSDDLIGSDGKIEAWGGYTCPSSFKYHGQLTLTLKDGTAIIGQQKKAVNDSTNHVDVTATNISGYQDWHADLQLFVPGSPQTIVSTGVVHS
ncbi:hypothetical protein [Mangrovihabitans endophyticus]|uniref:Secreted protein n=1 Tax=Mangrovihabitans endophyticus TaxID=1751298 RepID=A0A8J3FNB2_9ACTN|nr:hypothetical protein [Mangrovihabitans endophyticus]GGK90759.1 hypothetical protein GCM10012284_25740 [Mangrovihabitans endophyticus]